MPKKAREWHQITYILRLCRDFVYTCLDLCIDPQSPFSSTPSSYCSLACINSVLLARWSPFILSPVPCPRCQSLAFSRSVVGMFPLRLPLLLARQPPMRSTPLTSSASTTLTPPLSYGRSYLRVNLLSPITPSPSAAEIFSSPTQWIVRSSLTLCTSSLSLAILRTVSFAVHIPPTFAHLSSLLLVMSPPTS